ncbi:MULTISPECIES: ATP-binding protein [Thermomonosporaceae]|uniref:ATP-binding protein n=1 Tax=Thermomonosporaceae TaxID=2012 RepID=UPI00255AB08A|nr:MULTISPECIES: ATP-binding protein [Thermomonosporaceae]MDL4770828.1 ATP-binding protein [Actinomadura xylanilytica]
MAVVPIERPMRMPCPSALGPRSDDRRRLRATLELEALASSVPAARHFVGATLRGWRLAELADDATLVVTEIVTNAYQALMEATGEPLPVLTGAHPAPAGGHAATGGRGGAAGPRPPVITMRLGLAGAVLSIEVEDGIAALPRRSDAGDYDENGRGLLLVGALADRWGCRRAERHPGKVVWAELPLPS